MYKKKKKKKKEGKNKRKINYSSNWIENRNMNIIWNYKFRDISYV